MDKRSISKLFFTIMIKMLNNFAIQRWSVDPEFDSGEPVFTTLKPKNHSIWSWNLQHIAQWIMDPDDHDRSEFFTCIKQGE